MEAKSFCVHCFRLSEVVKEEMMEQIKKEILLPTINGMRAEGKPFIGCLFAGWSSLVMFS